MSETTFATVDVAAQWGRLNDGIIELVDVIPDDKLDWSPREELWNFRGILAHTAFTRHHWLGNIVKDGEPFEDSDVFAAIETKAGIQQTLRDSWARTERFLSEQANVDEMYAGYDDVEGEKSLTGHWIAFHLLEHDIHHRADIFHYLALLGIEHPQIGTP